MYAYDNLAKKATGDVERMFLYMAMRYPFTDNKDLEIYEKLVHELEKRGILQGGKI